MAIFVTKLVIAMSELKCGSRPLCYELELDDFDTNFIIEYKLTFAHETLFPPTMC